MMVVDGHHHARNMLLPPRPRLANLDLLVGKSKVITQQLRKPSLSVISMKLGASCQALLFKQNSCVIIPNGSTYGTA